jgi:ABC-2 family transporter protein
MKTLPYYLGLFTADYLLFLIPTALFGLLVGLSGLSVFSDNLVLFILGMMGFGFAIITFTYFLSSFFDTQDAAIKCNILI